MSVLLLSRFKSRRFKLCRYNQTLIELERYFFARCNLLPTRNRWSFLNLTVSEGTIRLLLHTWLLLAFRPRPYINWDACRSERRTARLPAAHHSLYLISERFLTGSQKVFLWCAIMNPPCGRCNKPVYPTEKINCLDKVRWYTPNPRYHFDIQHVWSDNNFYVPHVVCSSL